MHGGFFAAGMHGPANFDSMTALIDFGVVSLCRRKSMRVSVNSACHTKKFLLVRATNGAASADIAAFILIK